jgi:hypothetical protein
MKALLDQYGSRIKALEIENSILKEEVMKAGIKIPLSVYSGAIVGWSGIISQNTPIPYWTTTNTWIVNSQTLSQQNISDTAYKAIEATHGLQYANFIRKIHTDWKAIQEAYTLPPGSMIGGYEFIKKDSNNHVFVDIIYSGSTLTGVYDTKILYQYDTLSFKRKLIGLFVYDQKTGFYTTKTGTNPFAWITRTFIADPTAKTNIVPTTISQTTSSGGVTISPITQNNTVTFADIEKAYNDKRYLSVISLSNSFLQNNSATFDVLRIRYRTYFIIGKYSESLWEIDKIEWMWKISSVACDAKVIATYSNNKTLVDKYSKLCK